MRYLVVLTSGSTPTPPPPALFGAIAQLGQEAVSAGVLLDTAGLAPSAQRTRISLTGGLISATDGPFAEAKELVSYAVYEVSSKEEAVEWTNRFMRIHQELWPQWEGEAEVVQTFGPGDSPTPG